MSDTPGADTLELERELRDGPPDVEMTADGWNTLIAAYQALNCRAADAIAKQRLDLERCERMHLPAATAAAIQGHQQCMAAFDMSEKLRHAAETELASLRAEKEELRRERDEARKANSDLHRRAQEAEGFLDAGDAVMRLWGRYLAANPDLAVECSEAEVERVRERVKSRRQEWVDKYTAPPVINKKWAASIARAEAAESLLAEAGKALEPFAAESAEWSWKFQDSQQVSCRPGPPHDEDEVAKFTLGDLRRASAVSTRIASLTKEPEAHD